jgi:hypothetical protein
MISENGRLGVYKSHNVLMRLDNSICLRLEGKSIDVRSEGRRVSSMPVRVDCRSEDRGMSGSYKYPMIVYGVV